MEFPKGVYILGSLLFVAYIDEVVKISNLHGTKCEHLHISRFSNSSDQSFQVCYHNINTVGLVKDFDVFISSNLNWSQHIHHIYSRASVCSYQLLRAFSSKNVWTLLKVFITYVCPKLEYNSPV